MWANVVLMVAIPIVVGMIVGVAGRRWWSQGSPFGKTAATGTNKDDSERMPILSSSGSSSSTSVPFEIDGSTSDDEDVRMDEHGDHEDDDDWVTLDDEDC